jgi:arabinose-5-phosphate isomerase
MNMDAAKTATIPSATEQLSFARQVVEAEGRALLDLAKRLDDSLLSAAGLLLETTGSVIVTGVGKAGLIGQKIVATLASTGSRSHFLHPAEAIHGDLGRIHHNDVILVLSFSGESQEITDLLPSLVSFGTPIIAITGKPGSSLGRGATVVLDIGPLEEACSLGLAPSTSTTAMLALGDALALTVSRIRGFTPEHFARFHPGGSLGRKLARVDEVMRPLSVCRVANETDTVRDVLRLHGGQARRTGAVLLTNDAGLLTGLFTDSDLARLFERRCDEALDRPIAEVMTRDPKRIEAGSRMPAAQQLMMESKISELPVVGRDGNPLGLIDITDVFGQSFDSTASKDDSSSKSNVATPETEVQPVTLPFRNNSERSRTSV